VNGDVISNVLCSRTTDTSSRSSNDTMMFIQTNNKAWQRRFVMVTSNDLIGPTSRCVLPGGITSY